MIKFIFTTLFTILLFSVSIHKVLAVREPRPTSVDSRIRVLVYNPNDVFKFTGYYGYQTIIEFAPDEEVGNISMGDTTSWQIVPSGHRIFIKPVEQNATTNMTIITNKRTYFFELYAEATQDIRDPEMVFNVKFLYPDDEEDKTQDHLYIAEDKVKENKQKIEDKEEERIEKVINKINLTNPEELNFLYSISGSEEIAPIKIFDDGEFTYLQFRNKNYEMPAIFSVDEDLIESMVNVKIDPNYENTVIIEQVFGKLSLRKGNKVVCIFNESFRKV